MASSTSGGGRAGGCHNNAGEEENRQNGDCERGEEEEEARLRQVFEMGFIDQLEFERRLRTLKGLQSPDASPACLLAEYSSVLRGEGCRCTNVANIPTPASTNHHHHHHHHDDDDDDEGEDIIIRYQTTPASVATLDC